MRLIAWIGGCSEGGPLRGEVIVALGLIRSGRIPRLCSVIKRLKSRDCERCMDLAERVRWPREPEKWRLLFELGRGYGILGSDGALSAMVVIPEHEGASFVAMMVVDPRVQGRGLGRSLLEHVMAEATPPIMLYATAQGRPLYQRLGFCEVDYTRKLVGSPRATRAPSHVRRAAAADRAAIVDADARAFGAGRAALLVRLLSRAHEVVIDDRGGFAIRWRNGQGVVVGPVVAEDEQAAIDLVHGALVGCEATPVRIDIPVRSAALAAHLQRLGLRELDPAPLMTWPTASLPGDRARYHGIVLRAFG